MITHLVTTVKGADGLEDAVKTWEKDGYRVVSVCPNPGDNRLILVMADVPYTAGATVENAINEQTREIVKALNAKGGKK